MINSWELESRIDHTTGIIHYTLLTDGTEQDARLLARKLKGYVKDILPAQAPYVYAFELPCDMDEGTQDKLRTAIEEGVDLSNKVNSFIPGGSLGDPLFSTHTQEEDKDFPTFLTLDPSTSFFDQSGQQSLSQRRQLDLSEDSSLPVATKRDVLQVHHVTMDEKPENVTIVKASPEETQLSTAAKEVFATQVPTQNATSVHNVLPEAGKDIPAAPPDSIPTSTTKAPSTISISDNDMLLKDMKESLNGNIPLDKILSANTKLDVFVDMAQSIRNKSNTQPAQNDKLTVPGQEAFNVFEPETAETDNLLNVAEIHTITDKITQKNMDFMKTSNTPEEESQIPAAPQTEADASNQTPSTAAPATDPQAAAIISGESDATPSSASPLNSTMPENAEDFPEGNSKPAAPTAPVERDTLPAITIRQPQTPDFNMQEEPSQANTPPVPPAHLAQQPPHKTVLHLRRPALRPGPAPLPQDSEKTILRLRRKGTDPEQTTPAIAKPLRSTMSPERAAENLKMAKSKAIDHSIEIPISELKKHNWPLEVPLVPTYTMNNMVMSVNRFAHATAISVIDNPGKLYNPLVLHGGTGTGKTHFLNALAYSFSQKFGQEHIFMTNGVRLSRGIQRYVMEGNISKFEDFMESVRVLLIDDIHLLAINEQNRDFISKLLSSFLRNQKQIVITSKYPPESLAKLEELIKFRLDAGWISELKPATGATHFRIVKKMLIESGVDLNDKQIEEFFGGSHMTLGTVTRSIRRLKVLENLLFQNLEQDTKSQAGIFEKLLATKGEDQSSELITKDPAEITNVVPSGKGEWGRIGIFYPQNCSNMMNWIVYALDQRAKELRINGGFEIVVRSSYATENIISSAFKIANLCDNKKLKGAIILGPQPNACDPSVRENFYDILTHMLEIMLIRCGIINYEDIRLPSTYVKLISELMR